MTVTVRRRLVVCYGGTFDPIHAGHLAAAMNVLARSDCDELRFVPAAKPPLRGRPGASAAQRLRMVELALAEARSESRGDERLLVDAIELGRPGASYTIDTLEALRGQCGSDAALAWVLGMDAFEHLPRWARWEQLLDSAHLVLLERPGYPESTDARLRHLLGVCASDDASVLRDSPAGRIWRVRQPPVNVSATTLRRALPERGEALVADGLLSPAVWAYIREQGLYLAQPA